MEREEESGTHVCCVGLLGGDCAGKCTNVQRALASTVTNDDEDVVEKKEAVLKDSFCWWMRL